MALPILIHIEVHQRFNTFSILNYVSTLTSYDTRAVLELTMLIRAYYSFLSNKVCLYRAALIIFADYYTSNVRRNNHVWMIVSTQTKFLEVAIVCINLFDNFYIVLNTYKKKWRVTNSPPRRKEDVTSRYVTLRHATLRGNQYSNMAQRRN